jgi:hypothetical protein
MLREDVVEAVSKGKFHIYPVKTIDQGIEILTGKKAGKRKADGTYPKGSINKLVDDKLKELAEGLKNFAGDKGEGKRNQKKLDASSVHEIRAYEMKKEDWQERGKGIGNGCGNALSREALNSLPMRK